METRVPRGAGRGGERAPRGSACHRRVPTRACGGSRSPDAAPGDGPRAGSGLSTERVTSGRRGPPADAARRAASRTVSLGLTGRQQMSASAGPAPAAHRLQRDVTPGCQTRAAAPDGQASKLSPVFTHNMKYKRNQRLTSYTHQCTTISISITIKPTDRDKHMAAKLVRPTESISGAKPVRGVRSRRRRLPIWPRSCTLNQTSASRHARPLGPAAAAAVRIQITPPARPPRLHRAVTSQALTSQLQLLFVCWNLMTRRLQGHFAPI